ncbi:hypothetical protein [Rhodovulum steppense]|uniref:Glyceraldehyde-3-phosphate dehydrogenase n=1 Tax=Rhodovulum steppense TaxID=540251 RepID=A0A4R1YZ18_9RHOB|nr:hypothetical protein [Rhodovulum steppense]TCM86495.1 hypothetical protein EV216_10444 [Rhodovulum steppense]
MSNRIAIALMILAALALAADRLLTGSAATLFLARKFVDLVDYMAFWR